LFAVYGVIKTQQYLPNDVEFDPAAGGTLLDRAMYAPRYGLILLLAGAVGLIVVNAALLWASGSSASE